MRDFRDAKAMAQTLRDNLTAKAITISHSESLELVSKMFGIADWNTLSAMLRTGQGGDDLIQGAAQLNGATPYPAIPIRDLVPFPTMICPLFVGREKTMRALEHAFGQQREIVLAVQKDSAVDEPGVDDVYDVGALARLLEVERLPDGTMKVLVEVQRRVAIRRFIGETGAFQAEVADISEGVLPDASEAIRKVVERFGRYAAARSIPLRQTWPPLDQMRDPGRVADVIAQHMVLSIRDKQAFLAAIDPRARLEKIHALMESAPEPARSAELTATLSRALAHADQHRHEHATLEHLLLALIDDKDAAAVMEGCAVDLPALRQSLVRYIDAMLEKLPEGGAGATPTVAFHRVTQRAELQARETGRQAMTGADVLLTLFAESRSPAVLLLVQQQMTRNDALNFVVRGIVKPR
jgi:ATP-dependent Lon protease